MSDPIGKLDDLISVLRGERDERRGSDRIKSLKRTRIIYGDDARAMRCFVSDLSCSGAKLRPAEAEVLPDEFKLQLAHDVSLGCEVVYRNGDVLGVRFQEPVPKRLRPPTETEDPN